MQYVTRYIGPAMLHRPIPSEGRLCSGVDMHSPFRRRPFILYPAAAGDRRPGGTSPRDSRILVIPYARLPK